MNDNILILSDDNKEVVGVKDKSIKSLVIPDGVKKLGFKCFKGCKHLNLISIPKSVVLSSFGQVFNDCPNLKTIIFNCASIPNIGHSTVKEVIIRENVMAIDNGAFHECYNLTSIKVDKENAKYDSRDDCNAVIKTESDELIAACVNSSIPQSVRIIGEYAFNCLSGLSFTDKCYVVLPKSVVEIKEKAFYGSDIVSIIIPESVKEIGANAFSYCCSLTKVCINDGIKEIKKDTFSGCSGLTSITIPNSVTSIGRDAFHGCCNLKSLIIPEGVTIIGDYAFKNCDGLLSIIIPNSVMSVGYNAFEGCVNLSNVEFASIYSLCRIKFKSIQSNPLIFSHQLSINGKTIKKVIIPDGVTEIGAYTFAGCFDITNFYIPNSVTTINTQAFIDCRSITIVELSSNVKTITIDAFDGCESLNRFDVDKHNYYFTSIDGVLYDKSVTTLLCYPPSHEEIEFCIPEGVSVIGHGAFANCKTLSTIIIPESVTTIKEYSFSGCTCLSSIIVPNSVKTIGRSAFSGCVSLSAVVISNGISAIEDSLFEGCKSLQYIEIPNGVSRIGDYAFGKCTSLHVVIPESVVEIFGYTDENGTTSDVVFDGCKSVSRQIMPEGMTFNSFVSSDDAKKSVSSSYGISYSKDGKRLLSVPYPYSLNGDESNSYRINDGTEIICEGASLGFHGELEILHIPASVRYIGMYAILSDYFRILILEGKDTYFCKNFWLSGQEDRIIYVPRNTGHSYSKRLEGKNHKGDNKSNTYRIVELSKSIISNYLNQQKEYITKIISNNELIQEYTINRIGEEKQVDLVCFRTETISFIGSKQDTRYFQFVLYSLGLTFDEICTNLGISIETITLNNCSKDDLIGRTLVEPVYKEWEEEISDEETGEVVIIQRKEVIVDQKCLNESDIKELLDNNIHSVSVFGNVTPLGYIYNPQDDWLYPYDNIKEQLFCNQKPENILDSEIKDLANELLDMYKNIVNNEESVNIRPSKRTWPLHKDISLEENNLISLINEFYDKKVNAIMQCKTDFDVMRFFTTDEETRNQLVAFLQDNSIPERMINTYVNQFFYRLLNGF